MVGEGKKRRSGIPYFHSYMRIKRSLFLKQIRNPDRLHKSTDVLPTTIYVMIRFIEDFFGNEGDYLNNRRNMNYSPSPPPPPSPPQPSNDQSDELQMLGVEEVEHNDSPPRSSVPGGLERV